MGMSRKPLMVGNWKMNANHLETIQMVQKLSYRLEDGDYDRIDVALAPPFTALRSAQTVIEADRLRINLAAQNVHPEPSGAFTGEISAQMLAKLSVSLVIVGHSERRQYFHEDDTFVNRKAAAVLAAGMTPIICVGETLEERDAGQTDAVLARQISGALKGLSVDQVAGLVLAYEPVWAIGTGQSADPDDAQERIEMCRRRVMESFADAAEHVRILYGGSVNPGNIGSFMAKRDIDGGLVGGASLDPDTFAMVVRYWS
jgi:triosephosphate isomerase